MNEYQNQVTTKINLFVFSAYVKGNLVDILFCDPISGNLNNARLRIMWCMVSSSLSMRVRECVRLFVVLKKFGKEHDCVVQLT